MKRNFLKAIKSRKEILLGTALLFVANMMYAGGAKGAGAINTAANDIKAYVTNIEALIFAIAGVVGLIGGVRIYNKWQNGDNDINKEIMGWGGACIFIVLVPTFIKAFF